VAKPTRDITQNLGEQAERICQAVKAAAYARVKKRVAAPPIAPSPKLSADAVLPKKGPQVSHHPAHKIVVIGASTGGTEALGAILSGLPAWCPGIAVVQHMPAKFTKVFAERLNRSYAMEVKEAVTGDELVQGRVLIAPGDRHMVLKRRARGYLVNVIEGPLVNRHRPSVDVLFRSAVTTAGGSSIGVLLTGMGDDGASGLKELKDAGAYTIAQDENTCVVFGMPKEAIRLEGTEAVLPLNKIARVLVDLSCRRDLAASSQGRLRSSAS
jgi:two-component system chemotaxis response regulator CheB